ncbi:thiamine pyrophosphate-dependent enzyme [Desulfopila aestuarii]|uniref:thiamine pyrophosphate-dependent enzyme n=1 Tax=Desulfopila aestuarii TaxID=231440 RepID=UPI0011614FF7
MKDPTKGLVAHGVSTCAGCGLELAIRVILDVMGENTIIVIPPSCSALFSGFGNETTLRIPGVQGNLENTAAIAAGVRAGLEYQGKGDINVLGLAGDGGTADIGLQSLSGALERGDKILYVCYDNEAYMNTGIQGSSSTPMGAWTTTTPYGKPVKRKNLMQIVGAHGIPYAASASIGYIDDLRKKVVKAKAAIAEGPAFLHIHAPCPTGWGYDPALTVELAKLAVSTRCWNLFELVDGSKVNITKKVNKVKPAEEYLTPQKRFTGIDATTLAMVQTQIDKDYARLELLAGLSCETDSAA